MKCFPGSSQYLGLSMTSLKLHGMLSSTCRFHLSASRQLYRHVQLPVKLKDDIRRNRIRNLIPFSKLEEDEPQCNSWKIYAFYDTLNAVNQTSAINRNEGNLHAQPNESGRESAEVLYFNRLGIPDFPVSHLPGLLEKLKAVHLHLLAAEHWNSSKLKLCHRNYYASAMNLTHYLALKCLDLKQHEEDLSAINLLNLESINCHVLASIGTSILLLHSLLSNTIYGNDSATYLDRKGYTPWKIDNVEEFTVTAMKKKVYIHSEALFGEFPGKKTRKIMVTIGRECVNNEMLISNLLNAGADVIRINCAHDDPTIWSEIIRIVKHSSQKLEKPCRILMDLAGPKLRTGLLKTDKNIVKLSPKKDAKGDTIFPAKVWLCCDCSNHPAHFSPDAIICIQKRFLKKLKIGDYLNFVDFRGRKRLLKVVKQSPFSSEYGCMAECFRTAYVGVGTKFYVKGKKGEFFGRVLNIPATEQFVRVKVGDLLTIFRSSSSQMDELSSTTLGSAKIICSSDHLFESVKQDEPIAFDDGKILGKIQKTNANWITVQVTHASPKGSKLGSGNSINIPESKVHLKGLTSKDLVDLDFVGANADMVGISFIRDPKDILIVQHELKKRNLQKLGLILKIETKDGLEMLPSLLFQAMQTSNPLGVMIARGDLMVECGWQQMDDIQEDILSICSAGHIPVIWATQVLESLVKFGFPTRAEITDVFKAMRASCIMLNKGENIVPAVADLNSIITNRTSRHFTMTVNPLFNFRRHVH